MVSLFTLCYWRKAAADGLKNGWNREILMKSSWRAVLKKRKNWPFNACFCVNDKTIRPVIRQGFWPRHNSSLSTPKRKEIIYYSLTRLCIFGYITRASQKWRKQLLRYSVRAYLLLLSSWKSIPGHPPHHLLPISSCFAQSDCRVLIRKSWLLNQQFCFVFFFCQPVTYIAPIVALLFLLVLCVESIWDLVGSVSGLTSPSCVDTMNQEVC